jgi:hypothetical protein
VCRQQLLETALPFVEEGHAFGVYFASGSAKLLLLDGSKLKLLQYLCCRRKPASQPVEKFGATRSISSFIASDDLSP